MVACTAWYTVPTYKNIPGIHTPPATNIVGRFRRYACAMRTPMQGGSKAEQYSLVLIRRQCPGYCSPLGKTVQIAGGEGGGGQTEAEVTCRLAKQTAEKLKIFFP